MSWWEGLTRADLEREAERRGQDWKTGKDHYSMALGMDQQRDTWEPRGTTRDIMTRRFIVEHAKD